MMITFHTLSHPSTISQNQINIYISITSWMSQICTWSFCTISSEDNDLHIDPQHPACDDWYDGMFSLSMWYLFYSNMHLTVNITYIYIELSLCGTFGCCIWYVFAFASFIIYICKYQHPTRYGFRSWCIESKWFQMISGCTICYALWINNPFFISTINQQSFVYVIVVQFVQWSELYVNSIWYW